MKKFVKSISYAPKLDDVFSGKCRRTTRLLSVRLIPASKLCPTVGDEILFHEWTGRPYFSKWGRRIRVKVTDLSIMSITEDDVVFINGMTVAEEDGEKLARLDGIKPATSDEYMRVLKEKNGLDTLRNTTWAIIDWEVIA